MVAVLAVGVPALSWRSARVADEAGLSRRQLYLNAAVSLWILAALGFLAVALDGVSMAEVGLTWPHGPLPFAAWSVGLTIAGLAVFVTAYAVRRAGWLPPEEPLLLRMRPRGAADALLVVLVLSPSAGACEEFLYRGVVFDAVRDVGGAAVAAGVSGILFAGAHAYQGWAGALRAGVIGLMLAASPWGTGSILPAITAHALVDALGLVLIWPWLEKARRPRLDRNSGGVL
ncbi:MAG: CPBP family intramembrane glutamic endopeptidase [Candidatus Polarisedimenticolia bacterium]